MSTNNWTFSTTQLAVLRYKTEAYTRLLSYIFLSWIFMINATHHQSFYDTSRKISICLIYFPFSFSLSLSLLSLSYSANSILMLFIIIYDRHYLRELVYFLYFEHICNHVYWIDAENTLKPVLFKDIYEVIYSFMWLVLTRFLLHAKSIYKYKGAFWLNISNKVLWFYITRYPSWNIKKKNNTYSC